MSDSTKEVLDTLDQAYVNEFRKHHILYKKIDDYNYLLMHQGKFCYLFCASIARPFLAYYPLLKNFNSDIFNNVLEQIITKVSNSNTKEYGFTTILSSSKYPKKGEVNEDLNVYQGRCKNYENTIHKRKRAYHCRIKNGYLDESNRILLDKIRLSLVGYKNFKEMRQKVYGDLL
mgnify:FL=1